MEKKVYPADFANIIRSVSLLKDHCADANIKGGILRQRSNNRVLIFEADFTPLIGDIDIVLPDFKTQIPLLRAVSDKEVRVTTTDKAVTFSGQRSSLTFDTPKAAYVDNPFMGAEELSSQFPQKEESLILEYPIKEDVSNLVKVVLTQFETSTFDISFRDKTAAIVASATDKRRHAKIDQEIELKRPLKGIASVVVMPFVIDHDGDIVLSMYASPGDDALLCRFSTSVGKINV